MDQDIDIVGDNAQKQEKRNNLPHWLKRHPFLILTLLGVAAIVAEYRSMPSPHTIERLRRHNPKTTALMEARRSGHGGGWRISHQWVPLSRMSPHLIHAVIVSEDATFYQHDGVDWFEMQESLVQNLKEGRVVRGASTITQQLAKNLYLTASRDPVRKFKEFVLAIQLEHYLSKKRILELYLNLIEWGDGMFGVEAASQEYFGKPALDLTREEAAELASVIPSPLRHRPDIDSGYVTDRAGLILLRMDVRGW